jgi:hypothetical protein
VRGKPAGVTLAATRVAGFTDEIALAPLGLPPTIAAAPKSIPRGQSEVQIQFTPAANAPISAVDLAITGKAKFQNREFTINSPAAILDVRK